MNDQKIIEQIEAVIAEKTNHCKIFTAYDISKAVQSNLQNLGLPFPRHLNMKDDIHRIMSNSQNYCKEYMRIDNTNSAIVYYPFGHDPNQYNSFTQNKSSDNNSSDSDSDSDDKEDDKSGRKPDKRGTLSVPKRLLAESNFFPGTIVSVIESNGKIIITASTDGAISNYKVDCHGNVRITNGVLQKCRNLCKMWPTSSHYDFEKDNGNVVVKPV